MRFSIHTLGCKVNRAESETIAASLIAVGWEQTSCVEECELAIVNTCTVTGEADAKNRKLIRGLLRKTDAPVLVTGCAINIDADHYADIDERVVCESDKSKILELILCHFEHSEPNSDGSPRHFERSEPQASEVEKSRKTLQPSISTRNLLRDSSTPALRASAQNDVERMILPIRASHGSNFRTRVDLKIQDGCDNACSYCIVHTARGPAHSVPASKILEQTEILTQNGVKELVLVGIDLAAYKDEGVDLSTLITLLQEQTDIGRIRISSVEPQSITLPLIDELGRSKGRLCRHLHLCLQSGSSKVLEEMNRQYSAVEFLDLVQHLRKASPALALSTDVIVGFPGETDEDFDLTCELVKECGFMRLHVFRYSKRPGTPAAGRKDQIDPRVMAERSQMLQSIGNELTLEDMQSRLHTHEQVIIERPGLGTSESFHTVTCDKNLEVGSLVDLTFTDIDEQRMQLIV